MISEGDHIIKHLNKLLGDEFFAASQCFLHAKFFKSLGLNRLEDIEYKEYIDEINHAGMYVQRVLFLEGIPSLRSFNELQIDKDIEKILHADLNLEYSNVHSLRESIKYADSIQDYISRDLMIQILGDEEKHIDFLKVEINLIEQIGIHNYIQCQIKN